MRVIASLVPLAPWLVVGLLVGCAAALLARGAEGRGLFGNIVAGIAAALLFGGWLAPRLGVPVGNGIAFVLGALGVSLFGAVAAAWCVQAFKASSGRRPASPRGTPMTPDTPDKPEGDRPEAAQPRPHPDGPDDPRHKLPRTGDKYLDAVREVAEQERGGSSPPAGDD